MKSILISIRPKWCEKIASGEETIEVRKTRPKIDVPFKCYIYCTVNGITAKERDANICTDYRGKVIGEFVCDYANPLRYPEDGLVDVVDVMQSCLSAPELIGYSNGKTLYGWNISDLVMYDKPKELTEFIRPPDNRKRAYCWDCEITRAPQSWCYVEELA